MSRSPLGLRGLKLLLMKHLWHINLQSQPTRAAWIEITIVVAVILTKLCRSPLGLRGLKSCRVLVYKLGKSRSPLGLRGLKSIP